MSQAIDLFLSVAEALGYSSDKDIAALAGVSVKNVTNWRLGTVQEFKAQKLEAIKESIAARISSLRERGVADRGDNVQLVPIEVEEGSGPDELQRQFRDRVAYDYLGHRFLYYEPMGALAWENLIKQGYEQDYWLEGARRCAESWLDTTKDARGECKGPIAEAIGYGKKTDRYGLDVISLGPGEGEKEIQFLRCLLAIDEKSNAPLTWLNYAPVDVSIPLLIRAARSAQLELRRAQPSERHRVRAFCADFEEGQLLFADRLPSARYPGQPSRRLVMMLGNTFGNVRDEERFVRQKLWALTKPKDLVWIEVGLRTDDVHVDPLFRLTESEREETAGEANRRLLLEGPYRRWEAATGRRPTSMEMRVWVREDDDSCRVPGSYNFCHDLVLKEANRVCTMLYSRRYDLDALIEWLGRLDLRCLRISRVSDGGGRQRVAHLLLERS